MTEAAQRTFSALKPGDVLLNCQDQNDTFMVVRVGDRLDFLHLIDGRFLPGRCAADKQINDAYDVVREGRIVFHNRLGYKSLAMLFASLEDTIQETHERERPRRPPR